MTSDQRDTCPRASPSPPLVVVVLEAGGYRRGRALNADNPSAGASMNVYEWGGPR